MLAAARRPVLYVGVGVRRHGLTDAGRPPGRAARGCRSSPTSWARPPFPESHPQFAGIYLGALGDPAVRALLDDSDCVLGIGVAARPTWAPASGPSASIPKARVMIDPDRVQVRYHRYDGLPMTRVVAALLDRLPPSERPARRFDSDATDDYPIVATPPRASRRGRRRASRHIRASISRVAEVIAALKSLDQSQYSFVADVGDSWFIGLELRVDVFVAAGYYSSMGFAVPAALGVGIAEPSRRPLAIVGDGAFQMTGTELATLVDQGLRPIVLLLNNGGYGMLEAIDGPRSYYERRNWDLSGAGPSPGRRGRAGLDRRGAQRGTSSGPRPRPGPTSSRPSPPGTTSRRSWPASATTSSRPSGSTAATDETASRSACDEITGPC